MRLSRVRKIRNEQIHDHLKSIGAVGLRKCKSDGRDLSASRAGTCTDYGFADHSCFTPQWAYGQWVMSKPKHRYHMVRHITLQSCKPGCWKKATVLCIRRTKKGNWYMTKHTAGECPVCYYRTNPRCDEAVARRSR